MVKTVKEVTKKRKQRVINPETLKHISISNGNTKVGKIKSISLPPIISCKRGVPCASTCYACGMCKRFKDTKAAYERNWRILHEEPNKFWYELEAALIMNRFFRIHVSGDCPTQEYFNKVCELVTKHEYCNVMMFTKQFEFVNHYIDNGGKIPENFHILFSGWRGMEMNNPYHFPEAHVMYMDGTSSTDNPHECIPCGGNCETCAKSPNEASCWNMKKGDKMLLDEHGVLSLHEFTVKKKTKQ